MAQFPFSPGWVVPRDLPGVFVVFFPVAAPLGFVPWVRATGSVVLGVAPVAAWRSFPCGVAVGLCVSPRVAEALRRFPTGSGGSLHPSNSLPF